MKAVQRVGGLLFTKQEMALFVFLVLFAGLGYWRGVNDYQRRVVRTIHLKTPQYLTIPRCELEHR